MKIIKFTWLQSELVKTVSGSWLGTSLLPSPHPTTVLSRPAKSSSLLSGNAMVDTKSVETVAQVFKVRIAMSFSGISKFGWTKILSTSWMSGFPSLTSWAPNTTRIWSSLLTRPKQWAEVTIWQGSMTDPAHWTSVISVAYA